MLSSVGEGGGGVSLLVGGGWKVKMKLRQLERWWHLSERGSKPW